LQRTRHHNPASRVAPHEVGASARQFTGPQINFKGPA